MGHGELTGPAPAIPMPRALVPPGVYRPRSDTRLLAAALRQEAIAPAARVLDVCAGSGALSVSAARHGAADITAVDISRRAVWTIRANAWLHRVPLRAHTGGIAAAQGLGPFHLVLANPPYVPCPAQEVRHRSRRWDGGPDGRLVLDELCSAAAQLLHPGGVILVVQSSFADEAATAAALRAQGLTVTAAARARVQFGPVVSARTRYLRQSGRWDGVDDAEELVVLRGQRN